MSLIGRPGRGGPGLTEYNDGPGLKYRASFAPLATYIADPLEGSQPSQILHKEQEAEETSPSPLADGGEISSEEVEHSSPQDQDRPLSKRPRTSAPSCTTEENDIGPVETWIQTGRWPSQYCEQDDQTREYLNRDLDEESWLRKYRIPNVEQTPNMKQIPNMKHAFARKKSSASLRVNDAARSVTPSDEPPREEKMTSYKRASYETLLKTKGTFLSKHNKEGVTKENKNVCRSLLKTETSIPEDTLFSDDLFEDMCEVIQNRNEAKVIQDISRLIVHSAEHLAIRGNKNLDILIESVKEGWNNSIALTKPRPQPDYSVGFMREAFTDDQLNKLQPFVGELTDTSFFMVTYYMYFPFLTCETNCGDAALEIGDRQNVHSMTLAARGVVELFRLVKREKELNGEILAFSISHDRCTVRIYAHYPIINGKETTFW